MRPNYVVDWKRVDMLDRLNGMFTFTIFDNIINNCPNMIKILVSHRNSAKNYSTKLLEI